MARAHLCLLVLLTVSACARRPGVVLTNSVQQLDDGDSSVGVALGAYYATFVGEVEGLELTPVAGLVARSEDESRCRARVREGGQVLEVFGLSEGDAVVELRYLRPGSLRTEQRRVRFRFFALPDNPSLALAAPLASNAGGLELASHGARGPARCWLAGRGRDRVARTLGVQGREDVELLFCRPKREVAPGDWRPPECTGLCPDGAQVTVCAELAEGKVKTLTTFESTEAGLKKTDREGAGEGPCAPAQ